MGSGEFSPVTLQLGPVVSLENSDYLLENSDQS